MSMYDFEFSNAQALSTLDSTGVLSDNVWDLETVDGTISMNQTDFMVYGWVNFIITATTSNVTGTGTNFRLTLVSSSTAALTGTLKYLGGTELLIPEIITGYKGSFGVCRHKCEQYVGMWYKAATSLTGATAIDCWFSDSPITQPGDVGNQKRPNASFA